MPARTYSLTVFPNVRVTSGTSQSLSLQELSGLLTEKPVVNTGDKLDAPCFVPGVFSGGQRNKANFQSACCLIYDFDGEAHGSLTDGELLSILETLKTLGYTNIVYTTYNAGLRVVFPLAQDVSRDDYTRLFDALAGEFQVTPDKTGRAADRLHFLPQVRSQDHADRHMSELADTGRLLSLADITTPRSKTEAPAGGTFSGVKLSQVQVGKVNSFAALTRVLSTTKEKQSDLNRYVFALAKSAAELGKDPSQFALDVWEAARDGLDENPNPVADWNLAVRTVERAVNEAYEQTMAKNGGRLPVANAPPAGSWTDVPDSVVRRAKRAIKAGRLAEAGELVGRYVGEKITPEALVGALAHDVEESPAVISVPDALAALQAGVAKGAANPVGASADWQTGLAIDKEGRFLASDENCACVLQKHPGCRELFGRNVRTTRGHWYHKNTPWGAAAGEPPVGDHVNVARWLCDTLKVGSVGHNRANSVWRAALDNAPDFDPMTDYLDSLHWDGTERLSTWLVDCCGAEDSAYTRAVSRKWLISAVARTFAPGCQAENVLVLVGNQGAGKSSTARTLCPNPEWFGVLDSRLDEKENALKMARYVVAEVEEIDQFAGRRLAGELKKFVSERAREMRPAYGHSLIVFPRRAALIGTTNKPEFLYDATGARRWWPVPVQPCDVAKLKAMRDQLWAEAVTAFNNNETWWFTVDEQDLLAKPEQTELTEYSTLESEIIQEKLARLTPAERAPTGTLAGNLNGRVPIDSEQMDGDRMKYIRLQQGAAILRAAGLNPHGDQVRKAFEFAGLVQREKRRWYRRVDTDLDLS